MCSGSRTVGLFASLTWTGGTVRLRDWCDVRQRSSDFFSNVMKFPPSFKVSPNCRRSPFRQIHQVRAECGFCGRAFSPRGRQEKKTKDGIVVYCSRECSRNDHKLFNSFVVKRGVAYIFLTQRRKAIIDLENLHRVLEYRWYTFSCQNKLYAVRKKGSVNQSLHLFLTDSKCKNVDHIDRDGLNNRKYNLREMTFQEVAQHGSGSLRSNNTSGFMGVIFSNGKFHASAWDNYKNIHLGIFDSAEKAALARDAYVRAHYVSGSYLNFMNCSPSQPDVLTPGPSRLRLLD